MTFQPMLFQESSPTYYEPKPAHNFEKEADEFRKLGGPFAIDQMGIVTLDLGDGITERFRFIYNPNNYSVGRWGGPRVEIFGRFGYHDLRNFMRNPGSMSFDTWIRQCLESVKDRVAARFAEKGGAVFDLSASRLRLSEKDIKKILKSDDAARRAVREKDNTPVSIGDISYGRTHYLSHYQIQDMQIYFGSNL